MKIDRALRIFCRYQMDLIERIRRDLDNSSDTSEEAPKKTRTKAKPPAKKKKSIPKVVKDLSWAKWVGDDVAKTKCLCCGINEIKMNSFHCGHVVAEANGGSTSVENLRPICAACNTSMATENMDVFRARCGFVKHSPSKQSVSTAMTMNPSASLSLQNNNIYASASLGPASMSMSMPVNQVVNAIKNVILPSPYVQINPLLNFRR